MGESKQGDVVAVTITVPERIGWSVGGQQGQTMAGLLEALAKAEHLDAVAVTVLWERSCHLGFLGAEPDLG